MENREFENLLSQMMSPENSKMQAPDPLLVFEARQAVQNRKKMRPAFVLSVASVIGGLWAALRLQHLGVTALLVTSGFLYLSEINNSPRHDQTAAYDHISIITTTNNTISVISSTMLTSIPTLRN